MMRLTRRPTIKLAFRKKDKYFEIFGILLLISYWLLILLTYNNLPDSIPIHYNHTGEADNFGDKNKILNLPISATVIYIVITAFSKIPQYFNYLQEITEANAEKEYRKAVSTLRFLKVLAVVCYLTISIYTIYNLQIIGYANINLIIAVLPYILLTPTFYYLFCRNP